MSKPLLLKAILIGCLIAGLVQRGIAAAVYLAL